MNYNNSVITFDYSNIDINIFQILELNKLYELNEVIIPSFIISQFINSQVLFLNTYIIFYFLNYEILSKKLFNEIKNILTLDNKKDDVLLYFISCDFMNTLSYILSLDKQYENNNDHNFRVRVSRMEYIKDNLRINNLRQIGTRRSEQMHFTKRYMMKKDFETYRSRSEESSERRISYRDIQVKLYINLLNIYEKNFI